MHSVCRPVTCSFAVSARTACLLTSTQQIRLIVLALLWCVVRAGLVSSAQAGKRGTRAQRLAGAEWQRCRGSGCCSRHGSGGLCASGAPVRMKPLCSLQLYLRKCNVLWQRSCGGSMQGRVERRGWCEDLCVCAVRMGLTALRFQVCAKYCVHGSVLYLCVCLSEGVFSAVRCPFQCAA